MLKLFYNCGSSHIYAMVSTNPRTKPIALVVERERLEPFAIPLLAPHAFSLCLRSFALPSNKDTLKCIISVGRERESEQERDGRDRVRFWLPKRLYRSKNFRSARLHARRSRFRPPLPAAYESSIPCRI